MKIATQIGKTLRLSAIALVTAMLCSPALAITNAYSNLISDGDMEAAGTGAYGCSTNATLSKDSGVKYSGTQSLRISNTVPYLGSHLFPQSIAVPTNALFNGYVRAPASATLNTNLTLTTLGKWAGLVGGLNGSITKLVQSRHDGYIYATTAVAMYIYKTLDGLAWTQVADARNFGGLAAGNGNLNNLIETTNGYSFVIRSSYSLSAGETAGVWRCTDNTFSNWTLVAPNNPTFLYGGATNEAGVMLGATNGDIYVGAYNDATDTIGIWRSTDNGDTWTNVTGTNFGNSDVFSGNCLVQLTNGDILAGTGHWRTQDGIYRSTDNGSSWQKIADNTVNFAGSWTMSIVQADNGDIYVGVLYGANIYRSTDNGSTWTKVADGATDLGLPTPLYCGIDLLKLSNGDIWGSALGRDYSGGGIYKATANGSTWIKIACVRRDGVGGAPLFQASNGDVYTPTAYGSSLANKTIKTTGISVSQAGVTNDNNWYAIETVVKEGDLLTLSAGSLTQNDYLNYDDFGLLASFVENGGMETELETVHTGTAQGGAATTITLDATASAIDGYYTNMYIEATNNIPTNWVKNWRQITGYAGGTKVATVASAWTSTNPTNGSGYKIGRYYSNDGAAPWWTKNGDITLARNNDAHTGTNAQQVGAGDSSTNYIGQTVAVEQWKYYTFGAWLKRVSGSGNLNISISGAVTKSLSSTDSIYNKVSHTFRAGSTSLDIRLYADSATVGLMDDVSLVRTPPPRGTLYISR